MLADDSSYSLDPASPAHGFAPPPRHRRRAFLIGFAVTVAVCGLAFLALLGTGKLGRFTLAAGKRIAGVLRPNAIDVAAAQARLIQAGGDDLTFPLALPRLIVCKEYRELTLFNGDRFIKRYKVALGKEFSSPGSSRTGNHTPEAYYFIRTHELPKGAEPLFLGLGFARQDGASAAAEQNDQSPPIDTPPSGALGIHGVGDQSSTSGCIGLTDDQAAEIFAATSLGTPVTIEQ